MSDPAKDASQRDSITRPLEGMAAVTPHNTNELAIHTRALYVGVSGDVAVTTTGGSEVTLVGLAAGVFHPIRVKIVKATGTDATNIVAGY